MDELTFDAALRETTGKGHARRMRRAGLLPGIIYGAGKPDLPITLNANEVGKLSNKEAFYTSMLTIQVKGKGVETVLLKDVQWEPVLDIPMHLDFVRVSSADSVTVEVPVIPVNFEKSPGDIAGGMVDVVRHVLEVTCRADSIPDSVEVDCSKLELGDTVHVDDIALPEGMKILHEVNFTVLNISQSKGAAEAVAAEADEGEEEA